MVRPLHPTADIENRVGSLVGTPESWTGVSGGFSSAGLWTIDLGDRKLFVKASTSDETARFLRDEMRVLGEVEAAFLPEVIAYDDDGSRPVLILEDLSDAHWPPPWSTAQIDLCRRTLEEIARTPPPPNSALLPPASTSPATGRQSRKIRPAFSVLG